MQRNATVVVFLLIAAAAAHLLATRLSWRRIPLQNDTGQWSYIGWRMNHGERLYADLWETKPPGIYLVFAACVALDRPGGDRVAFCMDAAISAAVLSLSFGLARSFARPVPAATAVLLATPVLCHRVLADWGDNVEKFVALFSAAVLWAAVGEARRGGRRGWLAAGVFTGAAGFFKQTAVLLLIGLAICAVGRRRVEWPETVRRRLLPLVAGTVLIWLPMIAWLACSGILDEFWQQAVLYDLHRVAAPGGESLRVLSTTHLAAALGSVRLAGVLLLPAACGLLLCSRQAVRAALPPGLAIPAATGLLGLLPALLAPYGYGHYLLQIIPEGVVFAAICTDRLARAWRSSPSRGARPAVVAAVAVTAFGAAGLVDHLRFTYDATSPFRRAYVVQRMAFDDLAAQIRSRSHPGESVMLWPPNFAVSYYAQRASPLQASNADVLFKGKAYRLAPPIDQIIRRLQAHPPTLVADATPIPNALPTPGRLPEFVLPPDGMSLQSPPDAQHPNPAARLIVPLKAWFRNQYGGQEFESGVIYFRSGAPWRSLPLREAIAADRMAP